MQKDPRSRNTFFVSREIGKYLKEYAGAIQNGLNKISELEIQKASNMIKLTAAAGGRIFVGGNGGSAAISDHLCCDFMKGAYTPNAPSLKVQSLTSHVSLFTAIANDFGYSETLKFQLQVNDLGPRDLLILISSSGNSSNIQMALQYAKQIKCEVIGLTGFDGGILRREADCSLHIPINNYGVIEDCHQAIMHTLAQHHYLSSHDET